MNILEKLNDLSIKQNQTYRIPNCKIRLAKEVDGEIELQEVATTNIIGVYEFIINYSKSGFILADYIVFGNGMVAHADELGSRLMEALNYADWYDEETKILELNEGRKDDDYRSLASLLKEHQDSIEFMKSEGEVCELTNDLYVSVVGEREEIDGKIYHEEGMLDNKITDKTEIYDGIDGMIEIDHMRYYQVFAHEKRYVKTKGFKIHKLDIYRLKDTSKVAITTYNPFAYSDVFMMDISEIEIY